jgi:short-subunit dehydrogenase
MSELKGRWAVVTGASSGLGADFARELARRGCNTVLVARRKERLEALSDELEREHGVGTRVLATSLADRAAPQRLYDTVRDAGIEADVLVNNAGFGCYGPFLDIPWQREAEMLDVDVVALTHLTKLFAPDMVARGRGWILQMASIGAYQPSPTYATYSAAKAYVLSFGEALAYELRKTGVVVTVVSPGVTRTEFLEVSGQRPTLYQRMMMMDSPAVARIGIRALLRGRPSVVPGLMNAAVAQSLRVMPRRLQAAVANLAMNVG